MSKKMMWKPIRKIQVWIKSMCFTYQILRKDLIVQKILIDFHTIKYELFKYEELKKTNSPTKLMGAGHIYNFCWLKK